MLNAWLAAAGVVAAHGLLLCQLPRIGHVGEAVPLHAGTWEYNGRPVCLQTLA